MKIAADGRRLYERGDPWFEEQNRGFDTPCYIWTRSALGSPTDRRGGPYGRIVGKGRQRSAHKYVYEWIHGPVPEGLVLDHLCSQTLCVNPAHLEAVTQGENCRRGRNAKLSHRAVELIQSSPASDREIADRLGVTATCIYFVRTGRSWDQPRTKPHRNLKPPLTTKRGAALHPQPAPRPTGNEVR